MKKTLQLALTILVVATLLTTTYVQRVSAQASNSFILHHDFANYTDGLVGGSDSFTAGDAGQTWYKTTLKSSSFIIQGGPPVRSNEEEEEVRQSEGSGQGSGGRRGSNTNVLLGQLKWKEKVARWYNTDKKDVVIEYGRPPKAQVFTQPKTVGHAAAPERTIGQDPEIAPRVEAAVRAPKASSFTERLLDKNHLFLRTDPVPLVYRHVIYVPYYIQSYKGFSSWLLLVLQIIAFSTLVTLYIGTKSMEKSLISAGSAKKPVRSLSAVGRKKITKKKTTFQKKRL